MNYEFIDSPPGQIIVAKPWLDILSNLKLLSYNTLMNYNEGSVISQRPSRSVTRFNIVFQEKIYTLYLKRHTNPHIKDTLIPRLFFFHPKTAARREWDALDCLQGLGINTMAPVAMGEQSLCGIEIESFILTQEVPGIPIDRHIKELTQKKARSTRLKLINQLSNKVRTLHDSGLCYPDLVLKHLYVYDNEVYIIDVQRIFSPLLLKEKSKIKDLASLNISFPRNLITTTERIRFIKDYIGVTKLGEYEKKLIRKILKRCFHLSRTRKGYRNFFIGNTVNKTRDLNLSDK